MKVSGIQDVKGGGQTGIIEGTGSGIGAGFKDSGRAMGKMAGAASSTMEYFLVR